jgi:hypothetical protein
MNRSERERTPGLPLSQSPTAIRTYRILFRDARSALGNTHEADLGSDEEARQLAARMLNAQTASTYAEVWDRARLVCTVRRGE